MRRTLCVLIFMAMVAGAVLAVPRLGGVRQLPAAADPAVVDLNTTHRSSDGSDHTFTDQDVTSGSSPTLDGANITGVDAATIAGLLGPTIVTNIESIVLSNAFRIVRLANNRYEIHFQTNDVMTGQSVQDIFVHVDLGGANQSLSDSATTVITFSNKIEDVGSDWDSVTHQLDIPVNGVYDLYFQAGLTGTLSDQNSYALFIRTNNAQVIADITWTASGSNPQGSSVRREIRLTTNHAVEAAMFSGGTGDSVLGTAVNSYFEARLVRED